MNRVVVFKPTQDNWYGTYPYSLEPKWFEREKQGLVKVIFVGDIYSPIWRTCVCGSSDDLMLYDCDTEIEAWNIFLQVIKMEFVNKEDLRKLGYTGVS